MQKLFPWFTIDNDDNESNCEQDDICGDGIFDYYRCVALQDMKNIKKGDIINYIRVDMNKQEISGYDTDEGINMIFNFPFTLQLKLD